MVFEQYKHVLFKSSQGTAQGNPLNSNNRGIYIKQVQLNIVDITDFHHF